MLLAVEQMILEFSLERLHIAQWLRKFHKISLKHHQVHLKQIKISLKHRKMTLKHHVHPHLLTRRTSFSRLRTANSVTGRIAWLLIAQRTHFATVWSV